MVAFSIWNDPMPRRVTRFRAAKLLLRAQDTIYTRSLRTMRA
jgi:hypothetical protein